MSELNHEDNQLWFWESPYLRNKKFLTKVLNLDKDAYNANGWGNLTLLEPNNGENQKFDVVDSEIVCKWNNVMVDIQWDSSNVDILGCAKDNPQMQKWEYIQGTSDTFLAKGI